MCQRADKDPNPETAYWTAWTWALSPEAPSDAAPFLHLADRALASSPKSFDQLLLHGAVLYRAGRWSDAVRRLTEAEAAFKDQAQTRSPLAYVWLFLAMSQQRLGNTAEARRSLELAKRTDHDSKVSPVTPWNRRLTLQILRHEAAAMIGRSIPADQCKFGAGQSH